MNENIKMMISGFMVGIFAGMVVICTIVANAIAARIDKAESKVSELERTVSVNQTEYEVALKDQQLIIDRMITFADGQTEKILELEGSIDYLVGEVDVLKEFIEKVNTLGYVPHTLTRAGGVCYYNGHFETYYNLDMSVVISTAQQTIAGYADAEAWVRNDGCKMLGSYIMVATDYSAYPYGSIVETSLGPGIVVDTGVDSPNKVDLAVTW